MLCYVIDCLVIFFLRFSILFRAVLLFLCRLFYEIHCVGLVFMGRVGFFRFLNLSFDFLFGFYFGFVFFCSF